MTTTAEAISQAHAITGVGASVHHTPTRPGDSRPACDFGDSRCTCTTEQHAQECPYWPLFTESCNLPQPRRMVAVTIALSEPAGSTELDWPATLAAIVRLAFSTTTVEVIDSWRNDA